MSNVLHVIKDLKYGLNQIYNLLLPNGQLLFIEPCYKSIHNDSIFGVFDQWWAFTDTEIRKDRCTLDQKSWRMLLESCNFENIETTNEIEEMYCFLIQAKKPSLNRILEISKKSNQCSSNIIFYKNFNNHDTNDLENKFINEITNNFKSITLEYIQINQLVLEYKLYSCKHVLLSFDLFASNYLASSITGSFRYFCGFPELQLYSFILDSNLYINNNNNNNNNNNISSIIDYLIINSDPIKKNCQNEFIIKNNQVYYERYKQELKLKNSFKSSSFEIGNDDKVVGGGGNDNVLLTLTLNLQYQLDSKKLKLDHDEIEVKIIATGMNYKDYLVYAGLIPPNIINRLGDVNKPELGNDFSGIVTRVGCGSSGFKVGDQVYGFGYNTTASNVVINKKSVYYKPSNISHCEAASIPSIYVTNLYAIFNVGGLDIDENETILIHSAAGGIGLSALEILKWKGHKAPIFATVGSKEKEQYLLDNYGNMITAIYSTNNINYSDKIKQKLNEIGWKKNGGVDLILNTLSSDFMESNFKCLTNKGRIVDLSITHLNYNEFTCNNKFKYNMGYHNIELLLVSGSIISKLLKEITIAIECGSLKLIPITEFSNSNIEEAVEYIYQRKHIGKIIVNHDTDIVKQLILKQSSSLSNYSVLKSNYQINDLGNNIIITGQAGIAFEIIKWIVTFASHCIENIIILSKSSLKWELEFLINKTVIKPNNKIKFHFKSVDVSNTELMNKAIDEILSNNPSINNIDSILHFSFTPVACKVNEINMYYLNESHNSKTMGAINLHNQSIKCNWKLLNFIMASSISSVFGYHDQCSYVSTCNVLDNFSKYRNSIGLPSICINYGHVASSGYVARNESVAEYVNGEGFMPISNNKILGSLDLTIQNQHHSTNLVFCELDFQTIKEKYHSNHQHPSHFKFSFQMNSIALDYNDKKSQLDGNSRISDLFLNKVSELLSIDVLKVNTNIKLSEYGADSLFVVQLKNWIDKEISANILSILQLQNSTINESIEIISSINTNIN